jgi:hypothetical protein
MLGAGVVNDLPLHHIRTRSVSGRRKYFLLDEVACATNDERSHRDGSDLPQLIARQYLHSSYRDDDFKYKIQSRLNIHHDAILPITPHYGGAVLPTP